MTILYISYFYPPLGGPASFRNTKVVKYLAREGALIDVLSVADIEYLTTDEALSTECGHRKLIHCKSYDLMALGKKLHKSGAIDSRKLYLQTSERIKRLVRATLPIDDKIGWLPGLFVAAKKAISEEVYDLIYVSCGPFSSAIAAYMLSKEYQIPFVIDYRDYWSLLDDYLIYLTPLHRKFAAYWERKILKDARLVIGATQGIVDDLAKNFGSEIASKSFVLYNGWDEEDFIQPFLGGSTEIELAYFGAMYARRSLKHLYRAILEIREMGCLPQNLRIRLYGNFFIEARQEIAESGIEDIIEVVPQLGHREAIQKMGSASLLLLLINSNSPFGTLTSKVFEYLRCEKPILAMIPRNNEAARLIRSCGHDLICAMESTSSIKACLLRFLSGNFKRSFCIPREFERSRQIGDLHKTLVSSTTHRW